MKRVFPVAAFVALVACSTIDPVPAYSQVDTVSVDDIVLLVESDISDPTILMFLRHRQLDVALDANGIKRLREADVSEDVIQYLLNRNATPVAAVRTYVVPTGYRTGYPSYYYGARLVGTTSFSLAWYDHHYFGLAYSAAYRYPSHYYQSHGLSHSGSIALGHGYVPIHGSSLSGAHRSSPGHRIDQGHGIGHGVSPGGGHSVSHGGGHGGSHGGGHRGSHGGGHGGSHGGGH